MRTSYKISLLLIGIVMVTYSALYVEALSILHTNGFSARNLLMSVGGSGGDSYQYVALANTMLEHGRFAMSATAEPESFRTPGYPLFIALILAVFKRLAFLPLAQILLVALSCGLIFFIGERFFSRGIAFGAAILFAIDPVVLTISFTAMSDILFVFVMLCGIYVLTVRRHISQNLLLGGVLMGIMTLIRPLGLYVIPLVLFWLVWEARAEWRTLCRTGALFLVGAALVVVPWMTRNYMLFNHFSISSIGSYNLFFYEREFEHQYTGKPKGEITAEMYQKLGATTADTIESFRFADKNFALALQGIFAHPFAYTAFHLYSMVPFYFGSSIDILNQSLYLRGLRTDLPPQDINISMLLRTGDVAGAIKALTSNIPVLIERLIWLVLCIAALFTTIMAAYKRQQNTALIALFFSLILAFGLITGPVASARYRIPAAPLIFLLGCAGIAYGVRQFRFHYGV